MKKIIPFNNILTIETDVCEITAISLEHEFKIEEDAISGVFFISGEYKITDGQIEKDKFNFELPFDIALGCTYNQDTMVVDIDDFRYELIGPNKLKVNIDRYIDGEVVEEPTNVLEPVEETTENDSDDDRQDEIENESQEPCQRVEIVEELKNNKEEEMNSPEINIDNININNNENEQVNENEIDIFSGFNEEEKYVTYRVYRVCEGDTVDKILEKYNITKDEFNKYNNSSDIKVGDKLIIPAND